MTPVEQELQKVTGVKPEKKEDHMAYVKRVFEATNDLDDQAWDKLSESTQAWLNANAKLSKAGGELTDFPNGKTNGDKPTKKAAVPAKKAGKKDIADDDDIEAKPAKKAAKAPAAAAPVKSAGIKNRIKRMILKKPKMSADELFEKLKDEGEAPSKMTVSGIRAEFRHTIRLLKEDGWLSKDIDI